MTRETTFQQSSCDKFLSTNAKNTSKVIFNQLGNGYMYTIPYTNPYINPQSLDLSSSTVPIKPTHFLHRQSLPPLTSFTPALSRSHIPTMPSSACFPANSSPTKQSLRE
ncbi:hypothetical protein Droror1_Dr00022382 [Drosera rotundifolia]